MGDRSNHRGDNNRALNSHLTEFLHKYNLTEIVANEGKYRYIYKKEVIDELMIEEISELITSVVTGKLQGVVVTCASNKIEIKVRGYL